MKNKLRHLVLVIALLSVTNTLQATNYYIGIKGDDNNSGTSPQQAWRNISKVSEMRFSAGDSILFEGGQAFFGSIQFDSNDNGTSKNPITIGSYGRERAIIISGQAHGLHAHNCEGLVVKDLIFIGAGREIKTDFSGVATVMEEFFSEEATILIRDLKIYVSPTRAYMTTEIRESVSGQVIIL